MRHLRPNETDQRKVTSTVNPAGKDSVYGRVFTELVHKRRRALLDTLNRVIHQDNISRIEPVSET